MASAIAAGGKVNRKRESEKNATVKSRCRRGDSTGSSLLKSTRGTKTRTPGGRFDRGNVRTKHGECQREESEKSGEKLRRRPRWKKSRPGGRGGAVEPSSFRR